MANNLVNPYQGDCENICDKLRRFERAKQQFKILQSDFKYNSTTNTYTGTFLNIDVGGEIFVLYPGTGTINITPNTNTIIYNIAYDGTKTTTSITTEQKTVGEVTNLINSNTFTSSAGTCSFAIPIQFDGKTTAGGADCEDLKNSYDITPRMIVAPSIAHDLDTRKTTISGNVQFEALGQVFKKNLKQQTFSGNATIIKIYGNVNNFEIISANATSPQDLRNQCLALNTSCVFHYPFTTFGYAAFRTNYLINLSWTESVNFYDWSGRGKTADGLVWTRNPGNNTFGNIRAGFKDQNQAKLNQDTEYYGATTLNPSEGFKQLEDNVFDGRVVDGRAVMMSAQFTASWFVGGGSNDYAHYHASSAAADNRSSIGRQHEAVGFLQSNSAPRTFFIKNSVAENVNVRVTIKFNDEVVLWLNYD